MAKSDTYEQTMQPDYPSGDTEAQYIDDIFRAIKQAQEERLDQEHYWRSPDESDYVSTMEGAHRPKAGRVFSSNTNAPENNYTLAVELPADFPATSPPKQYEGLLVSADGTGELVGSLWKIVGNKVKAVLKRVRGMLFVNGRLILRKSRYLHGALVHGSGMQLDEPDYVQGNDYQANNLTLVPFIGVNRGKQVGQSQDDNRTFQRFIFPVFVGPFDGSGNYSAGSVPANHKIGVEFVLGNPADTSATRLILSEEGIEVFGSVPRFYVNGIDLVNHDHTGAPGMGKRLNLLDLLPEQSQSRLSAYMIAEKHGTASVTIGTTSPVDLQVDVAFKDLCPSEEFTDRSSEFRNRFLYLLKLSVQLNGSETADRTIAFKFKLDGVQIAAGSRVVRLADARDSAPWFDAMAVVPPGAVDDINSAVIKVQAVSMGSNGLTVSSAKLQVRAVVLKL